MGIQNPGVNVSDEASAILTPANKIDFVGAGVTASDAGGGTATVTIPGGLTAVPVKEEGTLAVNATTINFVGAGVTATDGGAGTATVTIPGATGGLVALASFTAAGGETSVDFSGISGAYQDLKLTGSMRSSSGASPYIALLFNNDSGGNYDGLFESFFNATGSGSQYTTQTSATFGPLAKTVAGASRSAIFDAIIPAYADTNFFKSFMNRAYEGGDNVWLNYQGLWRNVNAITQITLNTGPLAAGSTVTLYGMA